MIYYNVCRYENNVAAEPVARFERLYKAEEFARTYATLSKPLCVVKITELLGAAYRGETHHD